MDGSSSAQIEPFTISQSLPMYTIQPQRELLIYITYEETFIPVEAHKGWSGTGAERLLVDHNVFSTSQGW